MVDDATEAGNGFDDASFLPPGPRRSTYTPPVRGAQRPPAEPPASTPDSPGAQADDGPTGDAPGYDDDDLASALAEQLTGITRSGPIPIVPPAPADVARSPMPSAPLADFPAPSGPPVVFSESPAPDAATIVPPPSEPAIPTDPLEPPQRHSLPDEELVRVIADEGSGSGSTLGAIDRLQQQLSLREQEAREFGEWSETMQRLGTPEALQAVERARTDFTDIVPPAPDVAAPPVPDADPLDADTRDVPIVVSDVPAAAAERGPFLPPPAPPVFDLVPPPATGPFTPPPVAGPLDDLPPFEALVGGAAPSPATPVEPLVYHDTPPGEADPVFIEPIAVIDPEHGPLATGSQPIVAPEVVPEPVDDVDDTDRAFASLLDGGLPVTTEGEVILPPTTGAAPIRPMPSPRTPEDESVLDDASEAVAPKAFVPEAAGMEPTPVDQRVGGAARLFWLWFAANSSVLSVAFGGVLLSLGVSLRQAIVAAFVGVAVSFLPLGLGTLAGKWSGQPTMIASRATFGVVGNVLPALLALVTRLFWGAVLLWLIASSTARILTGAGVGGSLTETQLTIVAMAVGFVIAIVVAFFGYGLFSRIQLGLTVLSAVLVIGFVVVTWRSIDVSRALTVPDGPWILVVSGVVLVFSFVGLAWAASSGDLARYQRPASSGAASMLLGPFGSALPAFVLIGYGALLSASDPRLANGLTGSPLDAIANLLPSWYPIPLVAATVLSLLSGLVLSIYSGGFALQAVGVRLPRQWATVIVGVLLFVIAIALTVTVTDIVPIFRDLATSLAVPVAAWAGIFAAEMIIRRRRFEVGSLLARGGVYPTVNWLNLSMLVVASAIGLGLTTATVGWLHWEGYLFSALRVPLTGDLAGTDLGVLVALVLGLLTPLVAGIPTIRRQERTTL